MKKTLFTLTLVLVGIWLVSSCNKDNDVPDPDPKTQQEDTTKVDTTHNEPEVKPEELIVGDWIIDEATGNGNPDPSTTGKQLVFKTGGSYSFNGSFNGSWAYQSGNNTILMDAQSQYENVWEIETLTKESFIVTFKSPWDGKRTPLRWSMVPQQ